MGFMFKVLGASVIWTAFMGLNVFAQLSNDPVSSFNNILIGVSVLLVAVSFVFVMIKVARLIDLISARYESQSPSSKSTKR